MKNLATAMREGIVLLVPVRMLAGRFLDAEHLEALDAEEIPAEESADWAG